MTNNPPDIFKDASGGQKPVYSGNSYIEDYEKFMESFRAKEISGEEVGEMIARMAQHFIRHNLIMVRSLRVYAKLKSEIQGQPDGATGKPMTTSKMETIAASTQEAYAYEESKIHVQNIEQCINALKALQRGILFEYQHQ